MFQSVAECCTRKYTYVLFQNLTEFNTAHNRRISMLGIPDEEIRPTSRKRKKKLLTFSEEEEVINPEDVDPSVGRFRNMIHTTVIPTKVLEMHLFLFET